MNAKEKILSASYTLFCEKGYDETSVQEIVDRSGTSKGGFYHHFVSKEDVVEAIGNDLLNKLEEKFDLLYSDRSKSIYELINSVIKLVNDFKLDMANEWPGISKMLSFDGNTHVIQTVAKQFEKIAANTYYKLFLRGQHEGSLDIKYPLALAKMFAREILKVYENLTQVIISGDENTYNEFLQELALIQEIINYNLGLKEHKIMIKNDALSYLEKAMSKYNIFIEGSGKKND